MRLWAPDRLPMAYLQRTSRRPRSGAGSARVQTEDRPNGHSFAIHGPTLLLEYDNTQEDANHIHTVWHNLGLSFGDVLKNHYEHGHVRK